MKIETAITTLEAMAAIAEKNSLGREACTMAIKALEKQEKVREKYHNFCGYDLEKCMKYGNESKEQMHDSYSTMMMYEIALEFEDLIE